MARKQRMQENEQEASGTPDPYVSGVIQQSSAQELIDKSAELINPCPVLSSAVARDGCTTAEVPATKRFRVVEGCMAMVKGGRVLLRVGKIVDATNYDVPSLVSQGVRLVEIGD